MLTLSLPEALPFKEHLHHTGAWESRLKTLLSSESSILKQGVRQESGFASFNVCEDHLPDYKLMAGLDRV